MTKAEQLERHEAAILRKLDPEWNQGLAPAGAYRRQLEDALASVRRHLAKMRGQADMGEDKQS
jgi:hypothetical protein